jgi:hypothetical protein
VLRVQAPRAAAQVSGVANWHCTYSEQPYIEHLAEHKEQLVYLTADSSEEMQEVDPSKIYIIGGRLASQLQAAAGAGGLLPWAGGRRARRARVGHRLRVLKRLAGSGAAAERPSRGVCGPAGGLVDRNRYKSICYNRAKEQGIATAKLPIGNYMQLETSQVGPWGAALPRWCLPGSGSAAGSCLSRCSLAALPGLEQQAPPPAPLQVITVNQVAHILLKYLQCKDWALTFKEVIPQRKVAEKGQQAKGGQVGGGGARQGAERSGGSQTGPAARWMLPLPAAVDHLAALHAVDAALHAAWPAGGGAGSMHTARLAASQAQQPKRSSSEPAEAAQAAAGGGEERPTKRQHTEAVEDVGGLDVTDYLS